MPGDRRASIIKKRWNKGEGALEQQKNRTTLGISLVLLVIVAILIANPRSIASLMAGPTEAVFRVAVYQHGVTGSSVDIAHEDAKELLSLLSTTSVRLKGGDRLRQLEQGEHMYGLVLLQYKNGQVRELANFDFDEKGNLYANGFRYNGDTTQIVSHLKTIWQSGQQ